MMQHQWQDLRYGVRILLKQSGFTIVAVITLAIGFCTLRLSANAQTADLGQRFDAPAPKTASNLVRRGVELAGRDRIGEAIVTLKKAIAAAPNFLEAHREYIRVKSDFQGKVDEVRAEYEALMAREPENPIYPMALAFSVGGRGEMAWLKKVAQLAPEWSWGHYANSFVIQGRTWEGFNEKYDGKGEQILAEVLKAIEKKSTVNSFCDRAIHLQENLGKIDGAILTAEKMAAQPEHHADGLRQLWRLRLVKAKGSEQAKEAMRVELQKLAGGARNIKLLAAIRESYVILLKDSANADAIERRIRRLDPAWYPERGKARFSVETNSSGIPYALLIANRQYAIHEKLRQIVLKREADWRKEARQVENLLSLGPNPALKKLIYQILFIIAQKAGEIEAMVKYGDQLHSLDATETAPFARIALAQASKKTALHKALDYARQAEAALAEFHPMKRPPDIPTSIFESQFSSGKQRENYQRQRALAFDAAGWVLCRIGQPKEAEAKLRRSVEMNRTDTSLTHLAETLKQLGQVEEAEKIEVEISAKLMESVKKQFINRPAKDFQLEAIDGRKHRLTDLKGKVVLVSFWATWCAPCVAEMPLFSRIYEKYNSQGFEILAISVDDPADRDLVLRFAQEHRLGFPVLYDEDIAKLYDVTGYPGNVFIDRQGAIRYFQIGVFDDGGRRLEIILNELLK